MKNIIAIIPARSGSKGIKNKNLKLLGGKPLIGLAVQNCLKSKLFSKTYLSTDSEKYANIAKNFGAEVPYLRPKKLAANNSPEIDFVKHMLDFLEKNQNYKPDIVVRLMATVPLQTTDDIDSLIAILLKDIYADSAVVISEARQHPEKALKIVNDKLGKKLVTFFSESGREVTPIPRQNYDKAFFRSNIIACRANIISKTNSLTGDIVRFHIIPQERAIDIDNEIDFLICEKILMSKK